MKFISREKGSAGVSPAHFGVSPKWGAGEFFVRLLPALTILFLFPIASFAQPIPKLNSISREWIQRGATTEVLLVGENLSEINRFVFSDEGEISAAITTQKSAVRLEANESGVFASETPNDSTRVAVKLTVSIDATPGVRELRVITPTGVSNPINFNVSDLPETVESGGNHSVADAQKITLPTGLAGHIREAGQIDYSRFAAKKGERLIVDVNASRIGSPLDSSLAILDAKGKELARNEDANGFDSLLDFTVPEDGEYILQLRDFRYQGGADYKYHIEAGAIPYLDSIFPFGGERGKSVEVTLHGRNLEGVSKMNLKLDPAAPLGPQEVRARTAQGFSNSKNFEISHFAEVFEQEPNDAATNANLIMLPATVNGRIEKPKDSDVFKFKVEKGKRFIFEVRAGGFGSPLDALLILRDAKNSILQQNNGSGGANASIDQTFAEAGEYFISVRDLLDRGGENFGYRLAIRPPPEASFTATVLSDTPRVSRGGRTVVRVEVARSGFGGAVEISAGDLPDGVECEPLLIPSDFPGGLLEIFADENAELGSFPLKLIASAVINGKKVSEPVQALAGVKKMAVAKKSSKKKKAETNGRATKEAFLTVLDAPPFTVDFVTLSAQAEQSHSGNVRGEVMRHNGFNSEIKISLEGFSAGQDPITKSLDVNSVTVKADSTRFEIPFRAKLDSEIGTRPIVLKAEASAVTQFSKFIPLTLTEFPFVLSTSLPRLALTALPAGSTSAAGEAEFSVKGARRGLFTDEIVLSIEGLPAGIIATSTNLMPNLSEAFFKLTTNEKAKPGTNTFTVIGTANVNGRVFTQRAAGVSLIVNAPSNETVQK